MVKTGTSSEQTRILYLDALRGLMLVIMTFDHIGGPIKNITFQPLGFVSAAAGFIYLSGFVYGIVYTRKLLESDFKTLRTKSQKRAAVIYLYHILMMFVIVVPYLIGLYEAEELAAFRERPIRSFLLYAVFLYQPYNMDILPMYVLFILAGPYILRALNAGKWKIMLTFSVLLWFVNQAPILQYTRYDGGGGMIDLGYFNIFCWQILFFAGIFFGYAKVTGKFRLPVQKWITVSVLLCAVLCLLVRHSSAESKLYTIFSFFSDRSSIGLVRLVNFLLIAYLVYVITHYRAGFLRSGWLSLLGQHSLQVFVYSICLVYFFQPDKYLDGQMDIWIFIVIDLFLVATLTLPAVFHQDARNRFPGFRRTGL
ncbi:MAG TPA: OpgC domain-containing protein [Bacteroidales bacterium]|nr:OpgC domain-containing protein [Bacteroidales bacterium]